MLITPLATTLLNLLDGIFAIGPSTRAGLGNLARRVYPAYASEPVVLLCSRPLRRLRPSAAERDRHCFGGDAASPSADAAARIRSHRRLNRQLSLWRTSSSRSLEGPIRPASQQAIVRCAVQRRRCPAGWKGWKRRSVCRWSSGDGAASSRPRTDARWSSGLGRC